MMQNNANMFVRTLTTYSAEVVLSCLSIFQRRQCELGQLARGIEPCETVNRATSLEHPTEQDAVRQTKGFE